MLKSDSLEVKAKLAQSQYQIVQLHDTLANPERQLNELLARDLDTPFRTEQVPPITPAEMDLKMARQTALQQRPEVKEAEIDTQRAEYDRKLSRAKYIPDVGAAIHYLDPINTADSAAEYSFRGPGNEVGSLRLGRPQGRGETKGCVRPAEPLSTAGNAGPGDAGCRQHFPQARRKAVLCWKYPRRAATLPMRSFAK